MILGFFSLAEQEVEDGGGTTTIQTNNGGSNCSAPISQDIFITIPDINTWETCSGTLPGDQTIIDRMCELAGVGTSDIYPEDLFTADQTELDKVRMVATITGECADGNSFSFSYTLKYGSTTGYEQSMEIVDSQGNPLSGKNWCRYYENYEDIHIRLPLLDVGEGGIGIGFMLSTPCIFDCDATGRWTRTFFGSTTINVPSNGGWHHIDLMDTGSASNEGCE